MSAEEIIDAFASFDKEGSGKISAKELKQIMMTMGEKMTEDEADQMIKDAGGGSKIDYKKFVKDFNKRAAAPADED